jgi:hypothetical protein
MLGMVKNEVQSHEPKAHGCGLMLPAITIIFFAEGFVDHFRLEPKQMPVFTKDFATGVPSADQLIDEVLGALSPFGADGPQELAAQEVSAVKPNQTEELCFWLAVAKRPNCLNLSFDIHK